MNNKFFAGNAIGRDVLEGRPPHKSKLKPRVLIATLISLVILITSFTIVRATVFSADDQDVSQDKALISSKEFEVPYLRTDNLEDETVSLLTANTTWQPINYSLSFSDKAAREAQSAAKAQAAAAEANRVALSNAAVQSLVTAPAQGSPSNAPSSPAPLAPGNTYAPGFCTWYAYNRRYQIGRPIGGGWGNGGAWHYAVPGISDHTPEVGAVFEQAGHVAVVEAVGDNNTVFISEMNYGGLYRYNTRWVSNATSYWYIH